MTSQNSVNLFDFNDTANIETPTKTKSEPAALFKSGVHNKELTVAQKRGFIILQRSGLSEYVSQKTIKQKL